MNGIAIFRSIPFTGENPLEEIGIRPAMAEDETVPIEDDTILTDEETVLNEEETVPTEVNKRDKGVQL